MGLDFGEGSDPSNWGKITSQDGKVSMYGSCAIRNCSKCSSLTCTVLLDPNWLKPSLGVLSLDRTTLGASYVQEPASRSGIAEETAPGVPFIGQRISFLLFILLQFRFWVCVFCFSWFHPDYRDSLDKGTGELVSVKNSWHPLYHRFSVTSRPDREHWWYKSRILCLCLSSIVTKRCEVTIRYDVTPYRSED